MRLRKMHLALLVFIAIILLADITAYGQWTTRDHRRPPAGAWSWALQRELPQLYREFNGIDFGHAHLAETLLRTQDKEEVEKARLEVLEFIFSSPSVPPDEEQIAPILARMVWEVQRAFNWAHSFHRSLYDLFAAEDISDEEKKYRMLLENYLEKPEAITFHPLDHHGKLWSWPESKAFSQKFPKFNTQIWAYHWLQAAAYDIQLMGDSDLQRSLMPRVIEHYHGYLHNPPLEWEMMPMMMEASPEFSRRFPEAASIFDNLHMLHDNMDDVLSRPDLYPTYETRRAQILKILSVYLHRNHSPDDIYQDYHISDKDMAGSMFMGPRPPSVKEVPGIITPQRNRQIPDGIHGDH